MSKIGIVLLVIFGIVLIVYTVLVSPRRFFSCLDDPFNTLFRRENLPYAALPELVPGNRAALLVNGDQALPAMLDAIDSASRSIRWQVMLFTPDEAGLRLAAALERAARRGVQVQLSFDHDQSVNGSLVSPNSDAQKQQYRQALGQILNDLAAAGAVVLDNPPGVDFDLSSASPTARRRQQSISGAACVSRNHVDHRKILIVDGSLAITGGMNVGRSYLYEFPLDPAQPAQQEAAARARSALPEAWNKYQDVNIAITGPIVTQFIDEFNWRWEVLGGAPVTPEEPAGETEPLLRPELPFHEDLALQLVRQQPGDPQAASAYFDLVARAQSEIVIASPFVSYDPFLQALMQAAGRGVRAVFVFPNETNEIALSRRIFNARADDLTRAGVEVVYNNNHMAHTKVMVVDGQAAVIGSFNLNYRSFKHDLETAVVVHDARFANQVLEQVFGPYLEHGQPAGSPAPARMRIFDWFLQPFS